MIVFKSTIGFDKSKSAIIRLLIDKRYTDIESKRFYIFPFSLFSRQFYADLKLSFSKVFVGTITDSNFDLETSSIVFANRTRVPLRMIGNITDNQIEIKYKIPYYFFLLLILLNLILLFLIKDSFELKIMLLFINGFFAIRYIIKICRIQNIFKQISKIG